jgi:RNA ligase (TIGR02306 family)
VERKLVTIQSIDALDPITGADNIVKARVMGWNVVVKKSEFSVGDPCVFFEIDSVLPDGPSWSEFMRPRGFRVRTIKLRGVLSQGLALPVSIVEGEPPLREVDLCARLGVTKFEPVLPDTREIAGPFPPRVPKTDEIRLQSVLGVLDEIRGKPFYVSTKCNGASVTYVRTNEGLTVASRNWTLAPSANHVWRLAEHYQLARQIPVDFAVQGEVCGPGLHKNRLGLNSADLFVFNVYDLRRAAFLPFDEFQAFCADRGLRTVPIERVVRDEEAAAFEHTLAVWLEAARGSYAGTTQRKEGVVVRPLVEQSSVTLGGRLSFKVINNDYLLKDED